MSIKFNSFRAKRYLRTKFVEGKLLLASEGSDLELEIIDLLRTNIKAVLGDVAIKDAWKVERLSDTSILIKPGEAWINGLPFELRSSKDQLVTGSILTVGTMPDAVTVQDDPNGQGKILNFNQSGATPDNLYRLIVTASEELITSTEDPFLQNTNLTESTAQKVRINYKLSLIPVSSINESPIPYRDESSTSGGPITNYPKVGDTSDPNFVNEIIVNPISGRGDLVSIIPISGSETIDGRDLEIIVNNPSGNNPLPLASLSQEQLFSNGTFIDSKGTRYHLNAIFDDTTPNRKVIRIDKERNQPDPEIILGQPYKLIKRDIYVTDDDKGVPKGFYHWPIADIQWSSTNLLGHQSLITDLRNSVDDNFTFQERTNIKDNLILTNSGNINFSGNNLNFTSDFIIKQPFGVDNIISSGSINLIEDSSLIYELNLDSGGNIQKGITGVNITTGGTTLTVSGLNFDLVKVGNLITDFGFTTTYITGIDANNNQLTVADPLVTGNGTIFLDAFKQGYYKQTSNTFHLATRKNNKIYFYKGLLELEQGETNQIGDGISAQLLTYLGATDETDSTPSYSSTNTVVQGSSLTTAIGALDANIGTNNTELTNIRTYTGANDGLDTTPDYTSNIRGTINESLESRIGVLTDAVGDYQEDRAFYLSSVSNLVWTGTQLEFTDNIVLNSPNTKAGSQTLTWTILTTNSPIVINANQYVYITIDRTTSQTVTPVVSTTLPQQLQANKDIIVLFKRVDEPGGNYLYMPLLKQVIRPGKSFKIGAAGDGGGLGTKATFLDPVSTSLPTGANVTIDGVSAANGDLVLFTNLASGNNRIYELQGVGTSITWTATRAFDSAFDPTDGDTVRITKGDAFQEQLAVFDGTNFKVNDVVRYFDGVSGNFWEQSSIKTTTLLNNTNGNVFSVNVVGSENMIVEYSILRGSTKETGQIFITSDGSTATATTTNTYIGLSGITFNAAINSGNIELQYTADNSGVDATMKYFVKRWSNSPGGPTGIPNYSGVSGTNVTAAGNPQDVQFHGSAGTLDADARFKWDNAEGAINLNGFKRTALSNTITLNDGQTSPLSIINYNNTQYKSVIIEYSVERGTDRRTGRMLVSNDSTSLIGFSDDFVETNILGITFSATNSSGLVNINYTSTNTGLTSTFKYTLKKWL